MLSWLSLMFVQYLLIDPPFSQLLNEKLRGEKINWSWCSNSFGGIVLLAIKQYFVCAFILCSLCACCV